MINLTGLGNVASIGDYINIQQNNSLVNITGFESLTSVPGYLKISYNNSLIDLSGFDNLTSIAKYLLIVSNDNMVSFSSFQNLSSIGEYLKIERNDALVGLTGLENLNSIGGLLKIKNNPLITGLSGIENIDAGSIIDITIEDNTSLSECDVKSICDYLARPNGTNSIEDNTTGCNSPEEVVEACLVGIDKINEASFTLYPNPATNVLFISSENNIPIDKIIIYNQLGQNVLHQNGSDNPIDVSALQPGVYVIELVSGNSKVRKKLIIE